MGLARRQTQINSADLTKVAWHISTFSDGNGANCVEAGPLRDGSGRIAVRHSKHPNGGVIIYTKDEWKAFLTGVKAGEFEFNTPS